MSLDLVDKKGTKDFETTNFYLSKGITDKFLDRKTFFYDTKRKKRWHREKLI